MQRSSIVDSCRFDIDLSFRSARQQAGMGKCILRVRRAGHRVVPVLVVAGLRQPPVPPIHHQTREGVHPQDIR